MSTIPKSVELAEIIREREDLVLKIRAERVWWEQLREMGKPNFGQMASRLKEFRGMLESHFRREEAAEEKWTPARVPNTSYQRICGEHVQLLAKLSEITSRLEGCGEGYDCWGRAGDDLQALTQELQRQEETELEHLRSLEHGAC